MFKMKGFLRQKDYDWVVEWSNELEHKQPLHSLPLHPDDIVFSYFSTINRFELCEGKEVDFVISVRDEFINGKNVPIKYAKLTFPDLKRCPYVCSPTFCSCKDGMCQQHTKFLEKYDVSTDYLSDDAFENLEPIKK